MLIDRNETKPALVFLSSELTHYTNNQRDQAHQALKLMLADLGMSFKEVSGCYRGQTERSIMVVLDDRPIADQLTILLRVARNFEQESILFVDANRDGTLLYCNDASRQPIGALTEITAAEASQATAYTIVDGRFYTCK